MNLSQNERLSLYNQYLILEKLIPREAGHFRKMQNIVSNGYVHDYKELDQHIYTEMPTYQSDEVWEIFHMYDAISRGLDQLPAGHALQTNFWATFSGFDSNANGHLSAYARFIVHDCDKYTWLLTPHNHDFDNHRPNCLVKYRNMLSEYERMGKPTGLDEKQIQLLVDL